MFKTRYPIPGEAPGALAIRSDAPGEPSSITLIEYDRNDFEERTIADKAELLAHLDNNLITWINIDGITDLDALRTLGERFNLHPLSLEDVVNTGQRPKVEQYPDYLFIVVHMIYLDTAQQLCGEQVSIFLGKNFLITVQEEGQFDVFEPVRVRIRAGRGTMRRRGADYLAYALLDSIIDHYFPVLESIGAAIDKIDDVVAENPAINPLSDVQEHKRTLRQIRRFIWPVRDVTSALLQEPSGFVKAETKVYLRDCYDHTVQLMDLVESYRDVLSNLTELYLSTVSIRTNEIMRVLTVISAVFIPLTFIAGVYGMNFAAEKGGKPLPWNMPELYSPFGYVGCLLVMVIVATFQIYYFRKRKWL
jgi:magnesium transporter